MLANPRRTYAAVLITAAFFSMALIVQALWIPLKAAVAQVLIARSWQQTLAGSQHAQPWPWADTQSVGILQVPHLGVEQYILKGNSGRNLAFGPVMVDSTLAGNDRVISGHRDTHFGFLEKLQTGDKIRIETATGTDEYFVINTDIVDSREQTLVIEPLTHRLSLVTCYPFESIMPGGPLRYVVTALPLAPSSG